MREIAEQLQQWVRAGETVRVARVIEMEGFGSRRAGEARGVTATNAVGRILGGVADQAIAAAALGLTGGAKVISVDIGDPVAVEAGLACGGAARLLIQDAAAIPDSAWTAITERRAVAVATAVDTGASIAITGAGGTDPRLDGSLGDASRDAVAVATAAELLTKGRSATVTTEGIVIESIIPIPQLLVLGLAELADALQRQGRLLGWSVDVLDERSAGVTDAAVAATKRAGAQDAVVVLSHDLEASCAVLAAGLEAGCYVGALGSRGTQAKRAEVLAGSHRLSPESIANVHGPVGLDIGARSPEETSVAIFAEIIAHRSGRTPGSLRASSGPING